MVQRETYLTGFTCIRCGTDFLPVDVTYTCPRCGGNLDARYDYEAIRRVLTPTFLSHQEPSLWRYRPLLPLGLSESPISLAIGMTPLTRAPNLGQALGLQTLYIKHDGLNPSGSFKDRASFVVVAHCLEENIPHVCAASTGNAGVSLACLGASSRIETTVFAPQSAWDEIKTNSFNQRPVPRSPSFSFTEPGFSWSEATTARPFPCVKRSRLTFVFTTETRARIPIPGRGKRPLPSKYGSRWASTFPSG